MEAGNDPKQGTKHGSHHPAEPEPTATTYATAGAPSVTPGEQPFVRQTVAEMSPLSQPRGNSSIEGTRDEKGATPPDGSSWRPEMVDRRDLVPWEQRPILQRILDIPDEFKRLGLAILGRERRLSLEEVKGRARHFLSLEEPEITKLADMKLAGLIREATKRLAEKPTAYVGDLVYEYSKSRNEKRHSDHLGVLFSSKSDVITVKINSSSKESRILKAPNDNLSALQTRRLVATVLKAMDEIC